MRLNRSLAIKRDDSSPEDTDAIWKSVSRVSRMKFVTKAIQRWPGGAQPAQLTNWNAGGDSSTQKLVQGWLREQGRPRAPDVPISILGWEDRHLQEPGSERSPSWLYKSPTTSVPIPALWRKQAPQMISWWEEGAEAQEFSFHPRLHPPGNPPPSYKQMRSRHLVFTTLITTGHPAETPTTPNPSAQANSHPHAPQKTDCTMYIDTHAVTKMRQSLYTSQSQQVGKTL